MHSPFVYSFLRNVVMEKEQRPELEEIGAFCGSLRKESYQIQRSSFGAGSYNDSATQTLSRLIRNSSVNPKLGGLLFRICSHFQPKIIIEMGTSVGISTMYLSKGYRNARLISLEGDTHRVAIAKNHLSRMRCTNVEIIEGAFDDTLPQVLRETKYVDLVFIDGNHLPEPTLRYYKQCLEYATEDSIIVFDDIRWSNEMHRTWRIISCSRYVSVSLDFFTFGIVFFKSGIPKQHFNINF